MKKKNVVKLLLFVSAFALLQTVKIIASSLGGSPNYFAYEPFHHVFYDRESAIGFVRLNNGFTVTNKASGAGSTHGSMVIMDTVTSVSGAIDLRNTNTLFLNGDLLLENGVTFSTSGNIYSKGRSLLLGGNLTIPANTVLHLGGKIVIDGQGNTINLADNAQLFVDNNSSLTLRNLVISNSKNFVGNPAIKNSSALSQLTLDDVILDITGDFYFDRGSMFAYNDVIFTGTSAFVYRSCQPSFITSGARLCFDTGTTFSFAPSTYTVCPYSTIPTTTSNKFILMQDETSQICFDGANFVTTLTGVRLTNGTVLFNNKVSLDSNTSSSIAGIPLTQVGSTVPTGNDPRFLAWSPDGRFIAIVEPTSNDLRIYSFDGASSPVLRVTQLSLTLADGVDWSYDGKFIAVAVNGGTVSCYKFQPPSTLTSAGSVPLSVAHNVSWSPDSKLFAASSWAASSVLGVYAFTGVGNPFLVAPTVATGNSTSSTSWSPDGKFIVITNVSDSNFKIYRFTNSLVQVGSSVSVGTAAPYGAKWSPDGRFIAVTNNGTTNNLQIYEFDGTKTPMFATSASTSFAASICAWSPCGRFLVVGGLFVARLQVYSFNGFSNGLSTLKLMGSIPTAAIGAYGVAWSPNGNFIATASSSSPGNLQVFRVNYIPDRTTQALSNSVVFGNSALGSNYDVDVKLMSGANVEVDGLVNFDNVN